MDVHLKGRDMAEVEGTAERTGTRRVGFWARAVLIAAGCVGLLLLGRESGALLPEFSAYVESLGFWGPIVFTAGYALAVIAFVPGSLLTLAAGAIFGLLEGTIYVFVAAVLGSGVAFLLARTVARGLIERKLTGNPRFAAIDRAVADHGQRIVLLLRLSPVFPFSLLNYALGLTRVRFADYMLASVGMLPGTLLYVYTGRVIGDVAALAGGSSAATATGLGGSLVLALGFIATLAVTVIVTRIARRALEEVADA